MIGDIIKLAVLLIGKPSMIESFNNANWQVELVGSGEIDNLIRLYNLVIGEISEEFLPLTYKEDLTSQNGVYNFSDFTKTPIEIKNVYNGNIKLEKDDDYIVYPTYIKAIPTKITVEYEYKPSACTKLNDSFVYDGTIISDRLIALGVISEYYLTVGMFDEATLFRDRFIKSLYQCTIKKKLDRLHVRKWC